MSQPTFILYKNQRDSFFCYVFYAIKKECLFCMVTENSTNCSNTSYKMSWLKCSWYHTMFPIPPHPNSSLMFIVRNFWFCHSRSSLFALLWCQNFELFITSWMNLFCCGRHSVKKPFLFFGGENLSAKHSGWNFRNPFKY